MRSRRCLADTRVLCAGVPQTDLPRLRHIVHELGGQWQEQLISHDLPHVFVTTTVRNEKYKLVTDKGVRIPVVHPSWLHACHKTGVMVSMTQHKLGPFAGLTICLSGGSVAAKAQQQQLIVEHGGQKSPELNKSVTHLVITRQPGPRTVSEKEKHARVWGGIAIIWEDWLEGTAQAGVYRRDEAKFAVPTQETDRRAQPKALSENAARPSQAAIPAQSAGSAALPSAASASLGLPTVDPADDDGNDDDPFLDGVRYHLVACTPPEEADLGRIGRLGGATRYPGLASQLTHIVVGSDAGANPAALLKVRDHLLANAPRCAVVRADWLRECALRRDTLPSDARFALDAPELQGMARRAGTHGSDGGNSNEPGAPAANPAASQATRGALRGCWFTLTALQEERDLKDAKQIIMQNGGRMFGATSHQLVSSKALDKVFAVCPFGLSTSQLDSLRRQLDFRLVPEKNRVTMLWLDVSSDGGEPCRVNANDKSQLLLRPLPHSLPLPGADKIRVTASKLADADKSQVALAVRVLGGSYSKRLSKYHTHLIMPTTGGPKFDASASKGAEVVTADWLADSAIAGRFLPAHDYFPPEPGPNDMHPDATQFNVDGPSQPTQPHVAAGPGRAAKPPAAPISFTGVAKLAQQALPAAAGPQQGFGLDARPHLAGPQKQGGPAPEPAPAAPQHKSLLDQIVADSCDGQPLDADAAGEQDPMGKGVSSEADLLDELAAQPAPAGMPALSASQPQRTARKAISLPPHALQRARRPPPAAPADGQEEAPQAEPLTAPAVPQGEVHELTSALSRVSRLLDNVQPHSAAMSQAPDAILSAPTGDGLVRSSNPSGGGLNPAQPRPGSAPEEAQGALDFRQRRRGWSAAELPSAPQQAKRKAVGLGGDGSFLASQIDFSQQVGYDHTARTENPVGRTRAGR